MHFTRTSFRKGIDTIQHLVNETKLQEFPQKSDEPGRIIREKRSPQLQAFAKYQISIGSYRYGRIYLEPSIGAGPPISHPRFILQGPLQGGHLSRIPHRKSGDSSLPCSMTAESGGSMYENRARKSAGSQPCSISIRVDDVERGYCLRRR